MDRHVSEFSHSDRAASELAPGQTSPAELDASRYPPSVPPRFWKGLLFGLGSTAFVVLVVVLVIWAVR